MSTPRVAAANEDLPSLQALVRRYESELNEGDTVIARREATSWDFDSAVLPVSLSTCTVVESISG